MLNKKLTVSYQLFFWGFTVFALAIIYCLKENYTPPLLFLGIVNTSNELNINVFRVFITLGFLASLAEILFVFIYVRFLKKIKYDHAISLTIMLLILIIQANKSGLSTTDSVVISLLCLLWFVLRLFTLDARSKDFSNLLAKKIKYTEPEIIKNRKDNQFKIILAFMIISAFFIISGCFLLKGKAQQNFDKDLFLLTEVYAVLITCMFLALYNRQLDKYTYVPQQKISFIGTYNELVEKLFQCGFIFDRRIENYISFYYKTLFLPNQIILIREEVNQYSITGQARIIKHLEEDLNLITV